MFNIKVIDLQADINSYLIVHHVNKYAIKLPHEYFPRYIINLFLTGSGKWFEMQDLHTNLVLPEILPLSEAYIQIYERRK